MTAGLAMKRFFTKNGIWMLSAIAIVAVVSWTIILSLVQEGIKQIKKEQESIVGCGQ